MLPPIVIILWHPVISHFCKKMIRSGYCSFIQYVLVSVHSDKYIKYIIPPQFTTGQVLGIEHLSLYLCRAKQACLNCMWRQKKKNTFSTFLKYIFPISYTFKLNSKNLATLWMVPNCYWSNKVHPTSWTYPFHLQLTFLLSAGSIVILLALQ